MRCSAIWACWKGEARHAVSSPTSITVSADDANFIPEDFPGPPPAVTAIAAGPGDARGRKEVYRRASASVLTYTYLRSRWSCWNSPPAGRAWRTSAEHF
ncbi:MAG: hypothetical protein IPH23_11385 [Gammaproteobacteria bacterium]|nr:hypothetical protein [Gammaproteobacteria bacterium]